MRAALVHVQFGWDLSFQQRLIEKDAVVGRHTPIVCPVYEKDRRCMRSDLPLERQACKD